MPVHATLTTGIIPSTQLGSGTPDGTKFLRDDGTWTTVSLIGGGVSDGDKGDITVTSLGSTWTIDNGVISSSKLGVDVTTAGKNLLTSVDTAAQRTALGLGTAATTAATAYESAGGIATHAALTSTHGISTFGATLVDDTSAANARTTLGLGTAATANSGDFATAIHTHDATDIASGTVATLRLGSGVASSSTFLRGDQTWAVPSAGGGSTIISGVGVVTVPAPGRFEWEETFSVVGALGTHKVFLSLGAHADTDENHEAALSIQSMGAIALTDQITVSLCFDELTSGPIKINYMVV